MSGVVGVRGADGTAGAGGENPADGGAVGIHRRLVVVGTSKYRHEPELPLVPEELSVAVHVFGGLGHHIEERVTDADLATTRDRLAEWAYRTDGTGTSVVLYWTGHGIGTADRHYLLCADSHHDRLVGTALAAEDLTRIVLDSGAERVLLVVDTCDAGQGGTDAAAVAEQLHAALKRGAVERLGGRPGSDGRRLTDFAAIAVARAGEPASSMVFASALETALARLAVSQKQEYLSVSQVVDTVNQIFEEARIRQRARGTVESESHSFFRFENTGYRPEARYDEGDVAELAARFAATGDGAEAQRRRADLETHFAPRGQGFEHTAPGRHASYFIGRTEEIDRISGWLAHGDAKWRRGLIITGGPGVGKSALLGKLLLRSGGRTANAPAPTAIHARHRYLEDLVAAVADAAGITAATPQALLGSLATRRAPLHLIVDALDEAGEAHDDDTEARRIAQDLLSPLLRIPCVRLLVGMRPHVVDAFEGDDPAVLDLDTTRERSARDVADYACRLLQAPDGPASKGPYDDATARTVAEEIAARVHGGFLSARIAARYLGRAARAIDTTAPDWRTRVPEVGESPGDTFLRVLRHQLGPDAERGFALLGALALSEGAGLPPDQVWRAVAAACHPEPGTAFAWEDLAWLLDTAGEYLVEDLDSDGRSVYRLYHQAYADALRGTFDSGVRQRVADHLATVVPDGPRGPRWGEAPPTSGATWPSTPKAQLCSTPSPWTRSTCSPPTCPPSSASSTGPPRAPRRPPPERSRTAPPFCTATPTPASAPPICASPPSSRARASSPPPCGTATRSFPGTPSGRTWSRCRTRPWAPSRTPSPRPSSSRCTAGPRSSASERTASSGPGTSRAAASAPSSPPGSVRSTRCGATGPGRGSRSGPPRASSCATWRAAT